MVVLDGYKRVSFEEFNQTLFDRDPFYENTHSYGTSDRTMYVDNDFEPVAIVIGDSEGEYFYVAEN